MADELIFIGGTVKALGEGKVGGYLVEFTDYDGQKGAPPDLIKDFFTKSTDYDIDTDDKRTVYFDHGLDPVLKRRKLSRATLKIDDVGVWAEGILDTRDKYIAKIYEMVEAGKLGWSSGTAGHLVERKSVGNYNEIVAWPIVEASLTHTPCNPFSQAVSLKSLGEILSSERDDETEGSEPQPFKGTLSAKLNQHIDDLVDDGHSKEQIIHTMAAEAGLELGAVKSFLGGEGQRPTDANLKAFCRALKIDYKTVSAIAENDYRQSIKGMFETALAESVPSRWELESVYSSIIRKLAAAASAASLAGVSFDLEAKINEATNEYTERLRKLALSQVEEYLESNTDEPFYLKVIITDPTVSGGLDLDEHSQLAVSVLREVTNRFRVNHEKRVKSGRVLSDKNRQRIETRITDIEAVLDDLRTLLVESTPKASEEEKNAAYGTFLRLQWRAKQLGAA